jgi:mevalonate kinase
LADAPADDALALVLHLTLTRLDLPLNPDWDVTVTSQIPIASGLGSGAALATALVRAIFAHAGKDAPPDVVSELVFKSETLYHGTPSGIDNTVVAYGQPVWFVKGQPPVTFAPRLRFTLAIADSGISAPTKETVGDVRRSWQADPVQLEAIFDRIGALVTQVRGLMEQPGGEVGQWRALGGLFQHNQQLLTKIGVSSEPLEQMILAAQEAGSLGAKLSGGGRGGNVIALVDPTDPAPVVNALIQAGANRVLLTTLGGKGV